MITGSVPGSGCGPPAASWPASPCADWSGFSANDALATFAALVLVASPTLALMPDASHMACKFLGSLAVMVRRRKLEATLVGTSCVWLNSARLLGP